MKTTVTFSDFCDAFRSSNRNNQFSYEGKRALFDWIEAYEDNTGEQMELDVIALCCEYTEDHWTDIADKYQIDLSDCSDDDERIAAVGEYLFRHTDLITGLDNGLFIYGIF